MGHYRIERVDVSYAYVTADSPEEALIVANAFPDLWEIDIGETIIEEDN